MLRDISNYYGKVDENILLERFGLDKGISKRLLEQLESAGDNLREKAESSNLITRPSLVNVCGDPPIFLTKRIPNDSISNKATAPARYFKILEEMKIAMKTPSEKKRCFIPDKIQDLILEKGVQFIGTTTAQIRWVDPNFSVLSQGRLLQNITKQHPLYESYIQTIHEISNKKDLIRSKLTLWAESFLSGIEYKINLRLSEGEIEVQINENLLINLGRIFRFHFLLNWTEQDFTIESGWILKVKIQITFTDPVVQHWILFFSQLQKQMTKSYREILPKLGSGLSLIKKIWESLPNQSGIGFQEEDFVKYLKILSETNFGLWFSHIFGRLTEGEIFA